MAYISTVRCETHDVQLGPVQQYEDHEDHESSGLSFGVSQAHLTKHPDCTVTFTRSSLRTHERRLEREQEADARRLEHAQQEVAEHRRQMAERLAEKAQRFGASGNAG